jgi:D-3-phosphoglycerate dehydrogenase
MEKILILEPRFYPEHVTKELEKYGRIETATDPRQISDKIKDATVVLAWIQNKLDKRFIDAAPKVKIIATASAGVNHIDQGYAKSKGITVLSAPGCNSRAVAEFTVGLMLSLMNRIPSAFDDVKRGNWKPLGFIGSELENKTLGLVGFGKIPKIVAHIAQGFGMRVIANDPYLSKKDIEDFGVKSVTVQEIFESADVISLHTPLLPETKNMINDKQIEKMKKGVSIVNTSRGEVVDEAALVKYLKNGKIAGYACDVLVGEPPTESLILKAVKDHSIDNVIITPHIAHSSEQAIEKCGSFVVEQVKEILSKKV